jgi:hypothetical protein
MNKAILNSVQFFKFIYCLTRVSYEFLDKSISANRHTDTNETCRTERSEGNLSAEVCEVLTSVDDVMLCSASNAACWVTPFIVVYYESIKRGLKIRPI